MKGVGFALPFLSGQNIQGIALGEIFQSRGAEPGAVINLYFNGYTAAVRTTQEGFGVPLPGHCTVCFIGQKPRVRPE